MDASLLISAGVVVVGWFAAHRFSASRDRANKRRELRTERLIEIWRQLERSRVRTEGSNLAELESAVAEVQLFGTSGQVALVRRFATEMAHRDTASPDDLLEALRNDIREELGLEALSGPILWLRFGGNKEGDPAKQRKPANAPPPQPLSQPPSPAHSGRTMPGSD